MAPHSDAQGQPVVIGSTMQDVITVTLEEHWLCDDCPERCAFPYSLEFEEECRDWAAHVAEQQQRRAAQNGRT